MTLVSLKDFAASALKRFVSRLAQEWSGRFRWPSRRFFLAYCVLAWVFLVYIMIQSIIHDTSHFEPFIGLFAGVFIPTLVYLTIAFCYRVLTTIYEGVRSFIVALPEIWRAFVEVCAAVASFCASVYAFIVGVPELFRTAHRNWKGLSTKQKFKFLAAWGFLLYNLTLGYLLWSPCEGPSRHLDWLFLAHGNDLGHFNSHLFVTAFATLFACVLTGLAVSLVSSAVRCITAGRN